MLKVEPLVTAGISRTAGTRVGITSGRSEVLWTLRWGGAQARSARLAVPVPCYGISHK